MRWIKPSIFCVLLLAAQSGQGQSRGYVYYWTNGLRLGPTNLLASNMVAGNYVSISGNTNGTVTLTTPQLAPVATNLLLASPQWDDMVIAGTSIRVGGTAPLLMPVEPGSAIYGLGWDNNDEGHATVQFSHGIAATNALLPDLYIVPHMHVSVTNLVTGTNCAWRLDYQWAAIGEAYAAKAGNVSVTNTVAAVQTHYLIGFGNITNNALASTNAYSSIFRFKLSRHDSGVGDIGSVRILVDSVDIHYPKVRLGTRQPSSD